ncbi:hypothetical protein CMQ_7805 [Grosmannia clavigera kw1407]|uniref:G-protein coupled receptors family 1 profile domain-containing protein n=1 Tax=Grosmannia clavigera (strain kw1407 / UAMH 11150) TaxID=655863 RepID=F0XSC3_GROCL|nr:uncharacterized protein CMQ_7805 [Grosmannia clavigera kw1407]EFW99437.1 hypothetical protein CMQ_7805 [Grosmannia clavigera kw1407]
MSWEYDTLPRGVLAAPRSNHQTYILSSVILAISILSALGAGWIILSFAVSLTPPPTPRGSLASSSRDLTCCVNRYQFFKQLRSFRHRLILGLAFSDFVMAINFLSSSAMNLNGRDIGLGKNKTFCSYNGFMTQVFVIQTDYWVLAIGICTYLILSDHKIASVWAQDHVHIIGSLPWIFSVLWAIIGLATAGYGDIGAWCWFTSDRVRLFANFIPRWLIIVIMLIMYARLYVVLFRAHRFMSSSDEGGRRAGTTNNRRSDIEASDLGQQQAFDRRAQTSSTKRLKKLARLMIMYPMAYIFIWTLPTTIRIYQACTGKAAPFAVQTVDKVKFDVMTLSSVRRNSSAKT